MKTTNVTQIILLGFMAIACNTSDNFPLIQVNYPKTEKDTVIDNYFGMDIPDPYRWLEDDRSEKTTEWVKSENEVTFDYLKKIPFREQVRERINKTANYERYGLPFKKNNKYYFFKNTGLQNQSVLYVAESKTDEGKVFLDPNAFSADGTTAMGIMKFSDDASLLAYAISPGGADWQKIVVMNVESGKMLNDTIPDVKFTNISWNKDDGFFYSRYDKPQGATVLSGMTQQHKVYYHRLGTPPDVDKPVFGHKDIKRRYIRTMTFKNSPYLFIDAAEGTSGNELYFRKGLESDEPFHPIVNDLENDNAIVYAKDDFFYILTNKDAQNKRLVKVMAENPTPANWVDIIPEKDIVIANVSFAGSNIFVEYLRDASSQVLQFDMDGKPIREVKLPTIGTAFGFFGEDDDTDVFYGFQSFTIPVTMYQYEIASGESELFKQPKLDIDLTKYETKQVFFASKDGTRIPMFIVAKKDVKLDGTNPTLLYGYGGFNISLTPSFGLRWLSWIDMGGVFAIANLRGGGEYGEKWHRAGTKMNKQNVFDDFISASEYLIDEKYTSSERLTILGGSNGGLLIGAVMTQRPDLFRVALPAVGVMDMLRYHKFTAGAGWIPDYGCADSSKAMFEYLLSYSPVQNVKERVEYPATLVTTADHDDRVVPAHSFKFIANLQAKQAGELPVLIRIDVNAGHGAGKSTSMYLDEITDSYSFAFYNMKIAPEYYVSDKE
jgi:prolyl oligopeptidase